MLSVASQCRKPIDPQKEIFSPERCLDANSHKLLRLRAESIQLVFNTPPRASQINTYTRSWKFPQLNRESGRGVSAVFVRSLPRLFLWCPACQSRRKLVSVFEVHCYRGCNHSFSSCAKASFTSTRTSRNLKNKTDMFTLHYFVLVKKSSVHCLHHTL